MKKEQIENMIDKSIEKYISEGKNATGIMEELCVKAKNIGKTLEKQGYTLSQFDGVDFDSIDPVRIRYVVHYVRHCKKRMSDMVWIVKKCHAMKKTKEEMFKLLKFKEKMTCDSI